MAGILTGMAAGRSVLIAVCIGTAVCPIFFAGKNGRRLHFLCPKWSAGYTLRLFLFALLFLAGGLREQQVERSYDLAASHLTGQVNVEIQGRICKKDPGEPGICYQLKDVVVKGENFLTTADSFLLYSEQEEAVMGSVIAAEGIFYPYEQGRNEGNFDRGSYYRSLGISGTIYNAEYVVIESPYVQVREGLWRLREQMREIYDTLLNERDAGVLASMCLGDRSLLPDETKELYQVSGIMHLLAISGMHISILGMGAYRVLRKKFGFLISVIVSYLVVILFGMMIGAGASTLRAILMFGIYLLAQLAGRTYDLLSALAVAGILLLFHQPMLLTYAGFQFSFGAVLGIGIVYPVICVAFFPGKGDVPSRKEKAGKNILFLLAIQWTLLPVTLFHYCKVSVYSIFVNLILVPVAGILMGLGLAGGLAGLLSVRLAAVASSPVIGFWKGMSVSAGCLQICRGLCGPRESRRYG